MRKQMRHILILCLGSLSTVSLFQNCSPGFSPLASSVSQLSSSADVSPAATALYNQHCASCHQPAEISTKKGRSALQIKTAISDVTTMKSLLLTDGEIALIESALAIPITAPVGAQLKFSCTDPSLRGASNHSVRRLTFTELRNTLDYVIGGKFTGDPAIAAALQLLPSDELQTSTKEFAETHPEGYASTLLTIADRAVAMIETSTYHRSIPFGACGIVTPITDQCAIDGIAKLGQRVYRRPLEAAEKARYFAFYRNAGGGVTGLQTVLFAFLQAPPMAVHLEIGDYDQGGRRRLTDYEVASRISYYTLSTPPDDLLMAAAARKGELQSLVEVKKHVKRLLTSTSAPAVQRVSSFFKYYAGLGDTVDPNSSVGLAHGIKTEKLGVQLSKELEEYSQNIFWKTTGNFQEFMTSRESFPRSDSVQKMLGASTLVTANKPVLSDASHGGFLHRPAVLATDGPRTNPIIRGSHIRQRYFCDVIPEPPSDIIEERSKDIGDIEDQSNRALVTQLTSGSACVGCHTQLNPVGFAFENFDSLGMLRTVESVYSSTGVAVKSYPVDTAVTDPKIETIEQSGTAIADSIQLTQAIARGSKGRSCYTQKSFEFVHSRPLDPALDGCKLKDAEVVSHSGSLQDVLIQSIANEDIFWRRLEK